MLGFLRNKIDRKIRKVKKKGNVDEICNTLLPFVQYESNCDSDGYYHLMLKSKHKEILKYFPSHIVFDSDVNVKKFELYGKEDQEGEYQIKINMEHESFLIGVPERDPNVGPSLIMFYSDGTPCIKEYMREGLPVIIKQYYRNGDLFSNLENNIYREYNQDGTEKDCLDYQYIIKGYYLYYQKNISNCLVGSKSYHVPSKKKKTRSEMRASSYNIRITGSRENIGSSNFIGSSNSLSHVSSAYSSPLFSRNSLTMTDETRSRKTEIGEDKEGKEEVDERGVVETDM